MPVSSFHGSITDWNSNVTQYAYDDANRMTSTTLPTGTGIVTSYTYDDGDRLTDIEHVKNGSTTIASVAYTLDDVGNRTQRVDQQGTHTYAYDDLYRLTSVTYPGPSTTTYAFDAFGNREEMTTSAGTTTYSYDDADRITEVQPPSPAAAITYDWDDNGNLLERGADEFVWDYEDRMVEATVNAVTTTFAYRGDGLRNSRTVGMTTTTFTWDINSGLPVVLDDGPSAGPEGYVYGAGLSSMKQGGNWYYYLADGLGSTMAIVDASGDVENGYTYDVYGEPTVTGSLGNEFDFAGQQTDPGTGLRYLRARYYDPVSGTFMSRDPMADGNGWFEHPYGYGGANVTNATDPTGLWSCGWLSKVCGGIKGASSWVASQSSKSTKKTYEYVKAVGWNTARAAANAGLTAFALSLVPLDKLASCRVRSDGIIGCFGLGDLLGDLDADAVTIGNVILTREKSWEDLGKDTIAHEIAHADHWAVAGLSTWPNPHVGQSRMAATYGLFQALVGTCDNPFEQNAGIGPGTGVRETTCASQ